jgi:hypothetical protein
MWRRLNSGELNEKGLNVEINVETEGCLDTLLTVCYFTTSLFQAL